MTDRDVPVGEQGASVVHALVSLLPGAHGKETSEMEKVLTDSWDDDGEEWRAFLNGTDSSWTKKIHPEGDDWPDPAAACVDAGCHLIEVDGHALCVAKPDEVRWFTERGAHDVTKAWERGIVYAVRDRLDDLGMEDVPRAEELVAKEHRDHFRGSKRVSRR